MRPSFGHDGWGYEQLGLANDDGVLTMAARIAGIAVSCGLAPRAATAAFIAGAVGGKDYAYVQHLHHIQWATGEKDLLGLATLTLTRALAGDSSPATALGIEVIDDAGAGQVRQLAAALQVPPPPQLGWTAAVVAIYVPDAFGFPVDRWGVVQDRQACQYSLNELLTNAFVLIQNLRRTDYTAGGPSDR